MQILTLPRSPAYLDLTVAKDLFQTLHGRLPLIGFSNQAGQIIAHELVDGSVAVERHFAGRTQEIFVQSQGQVSGHIISVARELCAY